jgi:hypothetical protein
VVVHSNDTNRPDVPDQDIVPIHLNKGINDLMLKITQGGAGWSAHARIVGTDCRPTPGLQAGPKAGVAATALAPAGKSAH